MKTIVKLIHIAFFLALCNQGLSQCYCDDVQIIELNDTVTTQGQVAFTFKMTADSSNCNSGYSDFWFVDQLGDTINQWTGSGMWMPNPSDPIFDTTEYIIQLKPEYSSFPTDFAGNLHVWNPDCIIPFTLATLDITESVDLNPDVQLFPNPARDQVRVKITSGLRITSLEVYDSGGSLVLTEHLNTHAISVKNFNPGIYFVKLYSDERVLAVKKLVKN